MTRLLNWRRFVDILTHLLEQLKFWSSKDAERPWDAIPIPARALERLNALVSEVGSYLPKMKKM